MIPQPLSTVKLQIFPYKNDCYKEWYEYNNGVGSVFGDCVCGWLVFPVITEDIDDTQYSG